MQLSIEERSAVESGRLVRYVIPESRVECLLLRSDQLGQFAEQAQLGTCHPDEFLPLMAELLDDEDWTPPTTEDARMNVRRGEVLMVEFPFHEDEFCGELFAVGNSQRRTHRPTSRRNSANADATG